MFCYQCEQTAKGIACTQISVCGKTPSSAALQDLLVHAVKGISQYAHRAAKLGVRDKDIDVFITEILFSTITNVDFDPERSQQHLEEAGRVLLKAKELYESACQQAGQTPEQLTGPAEWRPALNLDGMIVQGEAVSIPVRQALLGEDRAGLQELIVYGLKGAASYMDHASVLGKDSPEIYAMFHEILNFLTEEDPAVDALLGWALKTGELNLQVMETLDSANTGTYGHPEPTQIRITPVAGKAILVSGHDLRDLEAILKQTEGKGINVYTHGEMLPCLSYPELKKYPHLIGNYGGAWQDQQKEFAEFPGPILLTTNCLKPPKDSYRDRLFTCGMVAWPNTIHIDRNRDFTPVIESALASPGFAEDAPEKRITAGFAHNAVLSVADQVIDAVKTGAIRHFFLIGGCDGAETSRNYYTDFAEQVPNDCVILTLGCAKYRFNKLEFGDIGGIPRLLDMGQCNDAYSAIRVALALSEAFECGVNDLPLSLIISWFEQKAVAVLLTLLHLGIQDIRLGPKLPAFVTPAVLDVLVEKFNISPSDSAEADLRAILGS